MRLMHDFPIAQHCHVTMLKGCLKKLHPEERFIMNGLWIKQFLLNKFHSHIALVISGIPQGPGHSPRPNNLPDIHQRPGTHKTRFLNQ